MSYALLAEVNTFHEQRVKDVKSSHQHFLQEQIKFYQKVRGGKGIYISIIIYDFFFRSLRGSRILSSCMISSKQLT